MTYLPTNVFKNILAYCDDRVERQQKRQQQQSKKMVINQLSWVEEDWYSKYIDYNDEFGNTTEERFEVLIDQGLYQGTDFKEIFDTFECSNEDDDLIISSLDVIISSEVEFERFHKI